MLCVRVLHIQSLVGTQIMHFFLFSIKMSTILISISLHLKHSWEVMLSVFPFFSQSPKRLFGNRHLIMWDRLANKTYLSWTKWTPWYIVGCTLHTKRCMNLYRQRRLMHPGKLSHDAHVLLFFYTCASFFYTFAQHPFWISCRISPSGFSLSPCEKSTKNKRHPRPLAVVEV